MAGTIEVCSWLHVHDIQDGQKSCAFLPQITEITDQAPEKQEHPLQQQEDVSASDLGFHLDDRTAFDTPPASGAASPNAYGSDDEPAMTYSGMRSPHLQQLLLTVVATEAHPGGSSRPRSAAPPDFDAGRHSVVQPSIADSGYDSDDDDDGMPLSDTAEQVLSVRHDCGDSDEGSVVANAASSPLSGMSRLSSDPTEDSGPSFTLFLPDAAAATPHTPSPAVADSSGEGPLASAAATAISPGSGVGRDVVSRYLPPHGRVHVTLASPVPESANTGEGTRGLVQEAMTHCHFM